MNNLFVLGMIVTVIKMCDRAMTEHRGGAPKWIGDKRQSGHVFQKNVWEI